jgi:DNA-binding MarR family transcriptional regulator
LTPQQAGVMRRLAHAPGESQRALADALGMHPPRLVALIDDLESRGLVQRSRDPADRRNYALSLTTAGREMMTRLAAVAREHERAVTAAIDDHERAELAAVLRRLVDDQGLTPGVHPGFRRAGR